MKILKAIWHWLDCKKTSFAAFYWGSSAALIIIWFPAGLPQTPNKIYLTVGILLSALGLGHKAMKAMYPKYDPLLDATPADAERLPK
jgi:hypothetical protein